MKSSIEDKALKILEKERLADQKSDLEEKKILLKWDRFCKDTVKAIKAIDKSITVVRRNSLFGQTVIPDEIAVFAYGRLIYSYSHNDYYLRVFTPDWFCKRMIISKICNNLSELVYSILRQGLIPEQLANLCFNTEASLIKKCDKCVLLTDGGICYCYDKCNEADKYIAYNYPVFALPPPYPKT